MWGVSKNIAGAVRGADDLHLRLVAALSAIAAGLAVSFASQADVPLYQRRGAFEAACRDAGDALLRLTSPSPLTFADDCRQPKITPVFNRAGFVIVTRVVMAPKDQATVRRTYSLVMDGRQFDAWRMTEMEQAPERAQRRPRAAFAFTGSFTGEPPAGTLSLHLKATG